jgi:hypothetical protein
MVVDADAEPGGHKYPEIEKQQVRGLPLNRQGQDEPAYEELPQGQGRRQMRSKSEGELPDRKRVDEGSDLPAVKSQGHEHEGIVEKYSNH